VSVGLDAPFGTAHETAACCWCSAKLVVGKAIELRCWLCPNCWKRQVKYALMAQVKKGQAQCLNVPLPSQVLFEEADARNVLWGGQAGPGKSHGVRWWLYKRSLTIANHKALLLRENYNQLEKTHLFDMRRELPLFGGRLANDTGYFPNGSEIHCGHMAQADSVTNYSSTEYGAIVCDEGSLYPTDTQGITPLAELSTRARKVYRNVDGLEVMPRFMPVTNPGGPSAQWLREMFIDHQPDTDKYPRLADKYDPSQWAYIPAKLSENPYQDPTYGDTLAVLSGVRYKQLAQGDWYAFAGAFFSEWDVSTHVRTLAA
jgi:hypothetical protein